MEPLKIFFYFISLLVIFLAIGMMWESHFAFKIQVRVAGKLEDVFTFASDPYVTEKVHPLV